MFQRSSKIKSSSSTSTTSPSPTKDVENNVLELNTTTKDKHQMNIQVTSMPPHTPLKNLVVIYDTIKFSKASPMIGHVVGSS